jgi:hypothetical protein
MLLLLLLLLMMMIMMMTQHDLALKTIISTYLRHAEH